MAVTVAELQEAVVYRCGIFLADAGRYLDDAAGSRSVVEGLRIGCRAVGLPLAGPLAVADADLANLSDYAVQRVLDWGELHALSAVLLRWHLVLKTHGVEPIAWTKETQAGYLKDQKDALQRRVAELREAVAVPYVAPDAGVVSVVNRDLADDPCCPAPYPYLI